MNIKIISLSNFFGMGKRIIQKYGREESFVDVDEAIAQAVEENAFGSENSQ